MGAGAKRAIVITASRPIAVLDSSVLVSQWSRLALQRLAARSDPPFVPVWSEWIIAETWRVLTWRWCSGVARPESVEWGLLSVAANAMMRRLLSVMVMVSLRNETWVSPWHGLRDRDDVPVWQTAVAAGAR